MNLHFFTGKSNCKIPIFNLDVYNRSFICIHDLCILPHFFYLIFDPRNFEQLKDQKRELEVSLKTNFEFFSKLGVWIKFGFTKKIHFHYIKNKIKREDKMTSSKTQGKYWKLNLESKYICWVLFAIYSISLAKMFIFSKKLHVRPDKCSQGHI